MSRSILRTSLLVISGVGLFSSGVLGQMPEATKFYAFTFSACNDTGNGSARCTHVIGIGTLHAGNDTFALRATANTPANYGVAKNDDWQMMQVTCAVSGPGYATCDGHESPGFRTALPGQIEHFVITPNNVSMTTSGRLEYNANGILLGTFRDLQGKGITDKPPPSVRPGSMRVIRVG
jgi:hypothetical protein